MRPQTMVYFERLCLASSVVLELVFLVKERSKLLSLNPARSMAGQLIGLGIANMLIFVCLFAIPYWLSLWAVRRKSLIANILLHAYFALVLLGLIGSMAQHGMASATSIGFFLHGLILAVALLYYWHPQSRDWLRRDDFGAIRPGY